MVGGVLVQPAANRINGTMKALALACLNMSTAPIVVRAVPRSTGAFVATREEQG